MKLSYTEKGKFVPITQKLIEELQADAVLVMVLGSRTQGSGVCCEMRVEDPEPVAWIIAEQLRQLADSIENDIPQGMLQAKEAKHDHNGHQQTVVEHQDSELRPSEPSA